MKTYYLALRYENLSKIKIIAKSKTLKQIREIRDYWKSGAYPDYMILEVIE